ncbi:MAG: methyltransferase, partial [Acetobacteraceae bacterium]
GEVLDAYRFARHRKLLDLGGGDGSFLIAAAARAPQLQLGLFDLPSVAMAARQRLTAAGLAARAEVFAGDMRRDPIPAGADLITLIRILHDHDDAAAEAILRQAHRALAPGGTLLVAEPMAQTRGGGRVAAYFGFYLLAMGSGRPRQVGEIAAMLRGAGFGAVREARTGTPMLVRVLLARRSA